MPSLGKVKYQGPEDGPFRCDHCKFFVAPRACTMDEVIAEPKMRKDAQGNAIVDPGGCCCEFQEVKDLGKITFESVGL